MEKYICLYLPDAMADWETGYVMQALSMQGMRGGEVLPLRTVSADGAPVRTIGGMTVLPDGALCEVREDGLAALLLPGADSWDAEKHGAVLALAARLLEQGVPVAAICGATLALAKRGLLDDRAHTSNSLAFLQGLAENYRGRAHYREDVAVADGDLITASSAGGLLWARLIVERLGLFPAETVEAWYQYDLTGDARFYAALVESFRR